MDQSSLDDAFSQMLGELDGITQQLEEISIEPEIRNPVPKSPYHSSPYQNVKPNNHVTDFDEEDVNLTAMLNDLCSFEESINQPRDVMDYNTGNGMVPSFRDVPTQPTPAPVAPQPMNTKPYFGTASRPTNQGVEASLEALSVEIDHDQQQPAQKELTEEELANLPPEEREERIKSEKLRVALEKMKEARIQKLVVKVYNKDNSSKTMVVDERMSTRDVMNQLIEKNHFDFSPNWTLVEEMPSLFLERMCEEHEKPCDTMKFWTRDTTNQLRFLERKDKYALFKNPQHYLLASSDQQEKMQERQKQTLIEEFFSGKGPSSGVPEVQGFLHIKNGKSWSRKYCLLRSSGLYVSKSGEPKKGKKLTDIVCLVMFEQTYLYLGRNWKKKFKAPYEYGFALKHPAIQMKSKHVRYLACEDFKSLMRWTVGIRLAKYGRDLLHNYEKTNEEKKSQSSVPVLSVGYRHEPVTDNVSMKSSDSGESRGNTLSRPVGVKNMFEGAWQRANQGEKPNPEVGLNRAKSVWNPNQKKSNNWWDLHNDATTDETLPADSSPSHPHSNNQPKFPTADVILPPPLPADSFLPPPPAASTMPPAPLLSPQPPNSTFTSYDDPLPPPPPMMGNPPPPIERGGYKPPPPVVPPKNSSRSPEHGYNNNIGRTAF